MTPIWHDVSSTNERDSTTKLNASTGAALTPLFGPSRGSLMPDRLKEWLLCFRNEALRAASTNRMKALSVLLLMLEHWALAQC